ncbi:MAG TPA: tagaturonate epimerase family protein [Alkalispirochaeta sp.]|nr:tagaturonate epimerase family protein [Alkalispirochaeta sp.]
MNTQASRTALLSLITHHGLTAEDAEKRIARQVAALDAASSPHLGDQAVQIYLRSLAWREGVVFGIARDARTRFLFTAAAQDAGPAAVGALALEPAAGVGSTSRPADANDAGVWLATAPLSPANARALHELFPWTRPVSLSTRPTTIGMGDRLGVATAGHLRAARQFDLAPVLAQQSVRENDFIGRTFPDVVANATWGVFQEGYREGYGADGDHLKNFPTIDTALAAGMPMITLDLTEVMKPEVAEWTPAQVRSGFEELEAAIQRRIAADYVDGTYILPDGTEISFDEVEAQRCAVMYGPAIALSAEVNEHLKTATGDAFDLEISIDETTTPTLPAHHLFIARELERAGVTVNSLAPRFIGEFQKAIDYIGDVEEFRRQFRVHCEIARRYGNYKISVHSGSDKFSVYPAVGEETGGRLHLKTSGTSWLEALRTVALYDHALYREIHAFVVDYYPTALSFYHITPDFDSIPPLESVADEGLANYLEDPNARQMLHISYGGILQNEQLRNKLYASLHRHEEEYAELLRRHFERHIEPLGITRR